MPRASLDLCKISAWGGNVSSSSGHALTWTYGISREEFVRRHTVQASTRVELVDGVCACLPKASEFNMTKQVISISLALQELETQAVTASRLLSFGSITA